MAIINCPSCKTRISDKAKICSSCQFDLVGGKTSEGLNEEQLNSQKKMAHMKKRYSLQMQAMIGIVLVLAGSLMWYFGGRDMSVVMSSSGLITLALGALLYLVTRVRLIMFKKAN